jgi:hypothetical protein
MSKIQRPRRKTADRTLPGGVPKAPATLTLGPISAGALTILPARLRLPAGTGNGPTGVPCIWSVGLFVVVSGWRGRISVVVLSVGSPGSDPGGCGGACLVRGGGC